MSLLILQHEPDEGPAVFGQILQDQGYRLRHTPLYDGACVPDSLDEVDGLVIVGGNMNVTEVDQHPWMQPEMDLIKKAHEANIPIVGICLGAQLIAKALGGNVGPMEQPELGWHDIKMGFPGTIDPIYVGLTWESTQFHLHGQEITELPPGATPLAGSKGCRTQAFKVGLTTYGFQYHFEWDQAQLEYFSRGDFVKKAGLDAQQIISQNPTHYHNYRRQGNRLCQTLATVLFT